MPVTILLKAICMNTVAICAHFCDFDHIELRNEGARLQFVPKHWRGEIARFDIKDKDGNVIVEKDKRINARHIRQLEEAKVDWLSVPDDYIIGRTVAKEIVNMDTGELIARTNDEITEYKLVEMCDSGMSVLKPSYLCITT